MSMIFDGTSCQRRVSGTLSNRRKDESIGSYSSDPISVVSRSLAARD